MSRVRSKAASSKFPLAKRDLGDSMIKLGNREHGLKLLTDAADSGDAIACWYLACRYEEGDGIAKSRKKYEYYLRRAAALGMKHAKFAVDFNDEFGWDD